MDINLPNLNKHKISHLLWADDLVLFAKDAKTLQKLLDILNIFVSRWELSINISKTNIMVFNSSSRVLNCSYGFKIGDQLLEPTKKYTYLGIIFSLNGSFTSAMEYLSTKATRAYIDSRALTTSNLLKLFDSLIRPIATYSSEVWLPSTKAFKAIMRGSDVLQASTKDKIETTHLKMLKWMLGLHKKASNVFCYGDSGRAPLALRAISQGIKYFRRVETLDSHGECPLVTHALKEQKANNLDWLV